MQNLLKSTLGFSMAIIVTGKMSVYWTPCNEETIELHLLKDSSVALHNEEIALNLQLSKARSLHG